MLPLYFYHDLKWKWSGKKQLKDIIVVAGFEIYDAEITPHYISPGLKIRLFHKLKKLQIQLFMIIVQS